MNARKHALVVVIAIVIGSFTAGCGATLTGLAVAVVSAVSGGGSSSNTNAPPSALLSPRGRSFTRSVDLEVTAADAEGDPVAVKVEFSLPGGDFQPAEVSSADASGSGPKGVLRGFSSSVTGVKHAIVWDATGDLPATAQQGVTVRVGPVDPSSLAPLGPQSEVVLTVGNDMPQIVRVFTDSELKGNAIIRVIVKDSTADKTTVKFEYLVPEEPGGAKFRDANINAGSLDQLTTDAVGVEHPVSWKTTTPLDQGGIGNTNSPDVLLRFTPTDEGGLAGTPVTATVAIKNNTKPGVRLDAMDPSRQAGSPVPIIFTVFDDESDPLDVAVEVSIGAQSGFVPATERAAGAGARELSDGEYRLTSGPFPTGVQHRFLWDMRADVSSIPAQVRVRLTPKDAFGGEGVPALLPPVPCAARFAFDLEAGEPPGTSAVALASFEGNGRLSLVGANSGRLGVQFLAPAANVAGRKGFLSRQDGLTDDGFGGETPIDHVGVVRVGKFGHAFLAPIDDPEHDGLVVVDPAQPAQTRIFRGFEARPIIVAGVLVGARPFFSEQIPLPLPASATAVRDIAVGDLDRDGIDDVAAIVQTTDDREVDVFLSSEGWGVARAVIVDPAVTEATTANTDAVAIFDTGTDGRPDVVAVFNTFSGTLYVATNQPGTPPVFDAPISLDDADLILIRRLDGVDVNGDGDLEIVASSDDFSDPDGRRLSVYDIGSGGQLQLAAPGLEGRLLASGRFDPASAETAIVAVTGPRGGSVARILTLGGNGFEGDPLEIDGETPIAAAAGDFDEDGDTDLSIVTSRGRMQLLFNDGLGALSERQMFEATGGMENLVAGDVDGDVDIDLVAPAGGASNLLRNPRPLSYDLAQFDAGDEAFSWSGAVAPADLDGDGSTDIVGRVTDGSLDDLAAVPQVIDGTLPLTVKGDQEVPVADGILDVTRVRGPALRGADGVAVRFKASSGRPGAVKILRRFGTGDRDFRSDTLPGVFASEGLDAFNITGDATNRDDLILRDQPQPGQYVLQVAVQAGGGTFAAPATLTATEILFVRPIDIDGDAAQDFLAVGRDQIQVWRGIVAQPPSRTATIAGLSAAPIDVAFDDVTGDGRKDVIVLGADDVIHVYGAATAVGPFVEAGATPDAGCTVGSGAIAAFDLDGDGRKDIVALEQTDCAPAGLVRTVLVTRAGPTTLTLAVGGVPMPAGDDSAVYTFGRPVYWDFDDDGRLDVAFSNGFDLVAVLPRASGDPRVVDLPQFNVVASGAFADVSGDGTPDLSAPTTLGTLGAVLNIEHRTATAKRFGPEGATLTCTTAPLAGAQLAVAPGGRTVTRTATMLGVQPFDPFNTGSGTPSLPIPVTANAIVSPPLALLPETDPVALTAPAKLRLPLYDAAVAGLSDAQILASVKIYRFEREGNGGRGFVRQLFLTDQITVVHRGATQRLVEFPIIRFGIYEAVIAR